jgi:hypothetical protein
MNAAYVFAQLGRPDLTNEWVRWIADEMYAIRRRRRRQRRRRHARRVVRAVGARHLSTWAATCGSRCSRFPQARVVVGGRGSSSPPRRGPAVQTIEPTAFRSRARSHAQLANATTLRFVVVP